ncbi:MAG TPA: hypothetical protein DHW02_08490, partial [Ktedonobacter sp.]|nr:hypothetical protein [Ktedonobacter sp.]
MKESPTPDIGFILNALAESLAHSIDLPEADSIRKQLAHVDPAIPLPEAVDQGSYSHDWSARTYETLCWEARKVLALGRSVILDASFIRRRDRDMMVQTASEVGATVFFVECLCPPSVAL